MDNETEFVAGEGASFTVVETPGIIPFFPSIMAAQPDVFNATECICSDLQHEDYSPLYAWFNYIVIIIMLPSLSAFGVITNIVNVFVYSRSRMRNSSNTYLLFLACSDFFVVLTGLFIFWIDSARSYIPQLVQAPYTTVYTLPFGYMAQSCSIYFTVAAAFDCYVCVCWRSKAKKHCTVKRAQRIVACIVLGSMLYNSLRFPQFNLRHCIHEGSKEMIVEICPTTLFFNINTLYNVYLYMIVMTLLPFSVLLLLNVLIIWRKSVEANQTRKKKKSNCSVSSIPKQQKKKFPPSSESSKGQLSVNSSGILRRSSFPRGRSQHSFRHNGVHRNSQRQAHIAAALLGGTMAQFPPLPKATPGSDETITMIMVVVLFLCCNTLALIVNLIETFFEPDALLLNLLSDASNFLVIFNSSVNCVIYLIFNNDYREVFLIHFVRTKDTCQRYIFCAKPFDDETEEKMDEKEEKAKEMLGKRREGEEIQKLREKDKLMMRRGGRMDQTNNGVHIQHLQRNWTRAMPPSSDTESPVWLSSDHQQHNHHHFCHCACNCPLLIRCACPLPINEGEEKGEEEDSGCDEDGGPRERSRSSKGLSHQDIPEKALHGQADAATTISSCYLAEVKIVPSNNGLTENFTKGTDPSPPHIYVRPLLRKKETDSPQLGDQSILTKDERRATQQGRDIS